MPIFERERMVHQSLDPVRRTTRTVPPLPQYRGDNLRSRGRTTNPEPGPGNEAHMLAGAQAHGHVQLQYRLSSHSKQCRCSDTHRTLRQPHPGPERHPQELPQQVQSVPEDEERGIGR